MDARARAVLASPERLNAITARSYSGHLQRLRKAGNALEMDTAEATFVGIRRAFAGDLYERSGGNRGLVAELLGQSSRLR